MTIRPSRRQIMKTAAVTGVVLAARPFDFLAQLPPVGAAEAQASPALVRLDSGIEPMVRLLEQTARDQVLEQVAQRIQKGTTYQEVLAALMLAAVRNVQPRPAVGFKFHSVLVVNAAHLASLASFDRDRWLPIFWAIDYFKGRQQEEEKASGWKMQPVVEDRVPKARQAKAELIGALDRWDDAASEAAIAGLVRTAGAGEVFELLYRYGARDFRAIGHKAIFVANCQRTLAAIGPQHAEPILRSLALALTNHQGDPLPSTSDLPADRPWRRNLELARKLPEQWLEGRLDADATKKLLAVFRTGSADDAVDAAVDLVQHGVSPQSVWDAVFVGSGEVLMRQPGIIGLHTLTAANALRFAFGASGDDATRRLMLLQACAFLPLFRQAAVARGALKEVTVDELLPTAVAADETAALEAIFADAGRDAASAAGKTLGYLQNGGSPLALMHEARRLVFLKGDDAHDYKFSSAVLEDCAQISPPWRARFMALSVFNLRGSGQRDNQLVERTRSAFG